MRKTAAALVAIALTCLAGVAWRNATVPVRASAATACDRQIVMQIDSAKISAEPDGVAIDAFGTSESAGWKDAKLVLAGPASGGVAHVDFIACRPEVSAQVLTPIQAHTTLDLNLGSTRQVIIRARTNSMTVDISH